MKKVMLIDPWGNNENKYFTGLIEALSKKVDLTLVSRRDYTNSEISCKILPFFFANNRKNNKSTKILKGINYIFSYLKIWKMLIINKYDVVHIQWLLLNKIDKVILKMIKKNCGKLVFTAHNVFPHVNGEKYLNDLNEIYRIVDVIILHGEAVKKEFDTLFFEHSHKVYIQRHGTYLKQITEYNLNNIDKKFIEKVNKYDKIFAFVGLVFYNKGVDRLVKIWLDKCSQSKNLLIVAGGKKSKYPELEKLEDQIHNCENIIYIDSYIDDDNFSFILSNADVVILPYRHASVSGVVFSAAEFATPVLTTNVGSISEYLLKDINSFVVDIDDNSLYLEMQRILDEISKDELSKMGNELKKFISENYDWNNIVDKLVEVGY